MFLTKVYKKSKKTIIMIKLLIFFLLLFVILFDISYARRIDINLDNNISNNDTEDYDDDFYDLDYDDENTKQSVNVWDPWEKMNRKIYKFNEFLLEKVARPFYYKIYVKITTAGIRKSIHNIVENFRMPIFFMNYVLQLDFDNSAKTLYSFGVNTFYGIFGIFDISGYLGTTPPNTDLGITLAKYHVPAGPYLMLPFLGPNDVRGTLTWGVEVAVDPLDYNIFKIGGKRYLLDDWIIYGRGVLYVLDNGSYAVVNFYDLMKSSFDPYVMMRDAYGQSQDYKIKKVRGN